MRNSHGDQSHHSAGDHKCGYCKFRTNLAIDYLRHYLNNHADKELIDLLNSKKSIDPPVIYLLAEQNMALREETESLRKDLAYIKEALRPKSKAEKFNCERCKLLCGSPTRIQEHMIEDHCCKYCERVFASKTEKELHKKYMCAICKKTFGHNLELHIHTKTYHKENNQERNKRSKSEEVVVVKDGTNTNPKPKGTENKHETREEGEIFSTETVQEPSKQNFKCTECNYQAKEEDNVIKHIESKHAAILNPMKVPTRQEFKCIICNYQGRLETDVTNHIEKNHSEVFSPANVPTRNPTHTTEDILLLGSSHMQSVMPTHIEKALKCKVFTPGRYPGAGRMYCSSSDWPKAKYPQNSMAKKVPEMLKVRPYKMAVLMSPDNDISILKGMEKSEQYRMAEKSAKNTVKVAEKALEDFPNLGKILLLEYLPRADNQAELVDYSNFVLQETATKAGLGDRIVVKPLTNLNSASNYNIFGPPNSDPKFNGIHLRGKHGSWLFTRDIINNIKSANQTPNSWRTVTNSSRTLRASAQQEEVTTTNQYNLLN